MPAVCRDFDERFRTMSESRRCGWQRCHECCSYGRYPRRIIVVKILPVSRARVQSNRKTNVNRGKAGRRIARQQGQGSHAEDHRAAGNQFEAAIGSGPEREHATKSLLGLDVPSAILVTCNDNFFRSLILEQNYLEQTIGRLRETDETAGPARECVSRRAVLILEIMFCA